MNWNQDLFKTTVDFAAKAHADQKIISSGAPYVVHVVKVATEILCVADGSFDVDFAMQCALLHDCVEDAGVTWGELERTFGKRVADGVQALTKDEKIPRIDRMVDALRRILTQPREVAMVKLADRITNMEPPPAQWSAEKVREYRAEANRIHDMLKDAHAGLAKRLHEKIAVYGAA